ncbi:hypothetical protein [Hirschia maritima]|uniref:hypothetical protein n=1 Tax=Hirschia maritima TaxID=1121961 RepID=UPI000371446C|nr:hypothetical protein [Hirschia maritima]
MKNIVAMISLGAALMSPAAIAQVSEGSADITMTMQKAQATTSISGLDDFALSYDENGVTGAVEDTFCLYSSTANFTFNLEGQNQNDSRFNLVATGLPAVRYLPIIEFINSDGSISSDRITSVSYLRGTDVTVDGSAYMTDETCTDFDNVQLGINVVGAADAFDAIDDNLEHIFSDTLTMTITPEL